MQGSKRKDLCVKKSFAARFVVFFFHLLLPIFRVIFLWREDFVVVFFSAAISCSAFPTAGSFMIPRT